MNEIRITGVPALDGNFVDGLTERVLDNACWSLTPAQKHALPRIVRGLVAVAAMAEQGLGVSVEALCALIVAQTEPVCEMCRDAGVIEVTADGSRPVFQPSVPVFSGPRPGTDGPGIRAPFVLLPGDVLVCLDCDVYTGPTVER